MGLRTFTGNCPSRGYATHSSPKVIHVSTEPPNAVLTPGLGKTYTFHEQQPGLVGALRSLIRRRS